MPVLSLPNEFERVLDVDEHSTFEMQRTRITSRFFEHGPTLAYRIPRALLVDGTVYTSFDNLVCRSGRGYPIIAQQIESIHNAQLCTNKIIEQYFGHWLHDGLLLEILAQEQNLLPLIFRRPQWLHEPGYRSIMSLVARDVTRAFVHDLWIIDDRGLNQSWAKRFNYLRNKLRSTAELTSTQHTTHFFIRRGHGQSKRVLLNEDIIIEYLSKFGFGIIDPETMSVASMATALSQAKMVVSVEGSAINHAQFALPCGASIVVIQPPNRFNALHRHFCDAAGLRFGFVVADPGLDGFTLNPERLQRTIDIVDSHI